MQNFDNQIFSYSFLSTGDSYNSLAARFHMGVSTVHYIIKWTCSIIWQVLYPVELKPPEEEDWKRIENKFATRWNFPNCCGALDGKHVVIQAPTRSGSLYYNYKGTFSLVLMALVDADYRFIYVDIGDYGSNSDSGIFKNSLFGQALVNGELNLPAPKALPNYPEGGVLPYCFVGDEAFPLRLDLMKPFPRGRSTRLPKDEQIFNYRLSRARRIVENGFGILVQRWRLFARRLHLIPDNAEEVVKACIVLHNYLTIKKDLPAIFNRLNPDNDPYMQDDGAILDIPNLHGHHSGAEVRAIRDIYKTYFNRPEGAVTWQDRSIGM